MYDPTLQGAERINCLYLPTDTPQSERQICEELLIELQNELIEHNIYVRDFIQICQIPEEDLKNAAFVISERERPNNAGSRTYTSHNLHEVSVLMPGQVLNI